MPPRQKRSQRQVDDNTDSNDRSTSLLVDLRAHEQEITTLKKKVLALEEEMEALKDSMSYSADVIVLRTIDREVAKSEILEEFQNGETLYFSDIAKRLRLPLRR